MIGEASFYGLYMPWLLPLALLALFVLLGVQRLLAAAGLYRRIWHPALFDTAAARADIRLLALCLIMGVTSWTGLARLLRGETLKLAPRHRPHLLALECGPHLRRPRPAIRTPLVIIEDGPAARAQLHTVCEVFRFDLLEADPQTGHGCIMDMLRRKARGIAGMEHLLEAIVVSLPA